MSGRAQQFYAARPGIRNSSDVIERASPACFDTYPPGRGVVRRDYITNAREPAKLERTGTSQHEVPTTG